MPIIFNHLHHDRSFVDQLVIHLSHRNVDLCMEHWALTDAEALIKKIQDSRDGSVTLLLIISKASMASMRGEEILPAKLLIELEKMHAVIIPVIVDDCPVPEVLQGMPVADFRSDFDDGVDTIVHALGRLTNPLPGNIEPVHRVDRLVDFFKVEELLVALINYNLIGSRYSYLIYVEIRANLTATRLFATGEGEVARLNVIGTLHEHLARSGAILWLADQSEYDDQYMLTGALPDEQYSVLIRVSRFGENTGCDIDLDLACLVWEVYKEIAADLQNSSDSFRH